MSENITLKSEIMVIDFYYLIRHTSYFTRTLNKRFIPQLAMPIVLFSYFASVFQKWNDSGKFKRHKFKFWLFF